MVRLIGIALVLTGLLACVSSNRYEEALAENRKQQEEIERLSAAVEKCEKLEIAHEELQEKANQLQEELTASKKKYDNLNEARKDLQEIYDDVVRKNRQLLESSSGEKRELMEKLTERQKEIDQKEKELERVRQQLDERDQSLDEVRREMREKEERINDLNDRISQLDRSMQSTMDAIKKAMVDFESSELSVEMKNGRLYVSLSQQLLFRKGSSEIGSRGKEALSQLSGVFQDMNDLSITVEGHTDSDGSVQRNWELSVERATEVVQYLQSKGVNPEQMIASGRALYHPVAPNDEEENKRLNRRTEIIINPDLEEIYEMIGSPKRTMKE